MRSRTLTVLLALLAWAVIGSPSLWASEFDAELSWTPSGEFAPLGEGDDPEREWLRLRQEAVDRGFRLGVDNLRVGGERMFGKGFRLRSDVRWQFDRGFEGAFDAVIPLYGDATQAVFVQPGAILWDGLDSRRRLDVNVGMMWRRYLNSARTSAGGLGAFYDRNMDFGTHRLGLSADYQYDFLFASANGYYGLGGWGKGRRGYEERPLSGADMNVEAKLLRNVSVSATGSIWDDPDSSSALTGASADAKWTFIDGVALVGGYEVNPGDLDDSFNVGVEASWPPSASGGGGAFDGGGGEIDLFRFAEREKRVLYAERRTDAGLASPSLGAGGGQGIVSWLAPSGAIPTFTLPAQNWPAGANAIHVIARQTNPPRQAGGVVGTSAVSAASEGQQTSPAPVAGLDADAQSFVAAISPIAGQPLVVELRDPDAPPADNDKFHLSNETSGTLYQFTFALLRLEVASFGDSGRRGSSRSEDREKPIQQSLHVDSPRKGDGVESVDVGRRD